ncbi:hisA/hisF family protein [Methanocaldococcus vulcanius M7]|uniref:HisA/hisF family protein n=1 Tax=Methanocaldococcus vulcanius (strain ATCC 700851 / DSM 12094 / M7) TaxID=579137 RepID=C9RDL3_METVM|nr:HisA/HisF family protein [Methanocaldococcus vulcanius]ACX73392.1 hisA/hisF family protein [Methanocaldococcus vulcanius M7]
MHIIPVIDIKGNIAVHGKSGMRSKYQPLKSVICETSDPICLAKSYKEKGSEMVYIADLDAICGEGDNFNLIKNIDFINKIVDAGIKTREDLERVREYLNKNDKAIIATETLIDKELISEKNIIVSLDFKDGKLLNYTVEEVLGLVRKDTPLIILDISSVGTGRGINMKLINMILKLNKGKNPIYVGGGIRDITDIEKCYNLGIDGVLVGTAIHRGVIDLEEVIKKFEKF